MSKEQELYLSIVNVTKNGNDAEVKRGLHYPTMN